MDNEISGNTGSHYTATYWEYDARLGRRWNLDPKPFASLSQYSCFINNPIWFADPLGDSVRFAKDLTKRERKQINTNLDKLKKDESFAKMYKALESDKNVFMVGKKAHPNDPNAKGYLDYTDPKNLQINFLALNEEENILGIMAEEFFHAYQYSYYGDSYFNYLAESTTIEVEAKLFTGSLIGELGLTGYDFRGKSNSVAYNFNRNKFAIHAYYLTVFKGEKQWKGSLSSKDNYTLIFGQIYDQQHNIINRQYNLPIEKDHSYTYYRNDAFESVFTPYQEPIQEPSKGGFPWSK